MGVIVAIPLGLAQDTYGPPLLCTKRSAHIDIMGSPNICDLKCNTHLTGYSFAFLARPSNYPHSQSRSADILNHRDVDASGISDADKCTYSRI